MKNHPRKALKSQGMSRSKTLSQRILRSKKTSHPLKLTQKSLQVFTTKHYIYCILRTVLQRISERILKLHFHEKPYKNSSEKSGNVAFKNPGSGNFEIQVNLLSCNIILAQKLSKAFTTKHSTVFYAQFYNVSLSVSCFEAGWYLFGSRRGRGWRLHTWALPGYPSPPGKTTHLQW